MKEICIDGFYGLPHKKLKISFEPFKPSEYRGLRQSVDAETGKYGTEPKGQAKPEPKPEPKATGIKAIYANSKAKVVVVIFENGDRQVVKCDDKDDFSLEVGVALAIARESFGTKTQFRKFIDKKAVLAEPKEKETPKTPQNQPEKQKRGRPKKATAKNKGDLE